MRKAMYVMKWFKHDSNAHTDAKLKKVRHKYGIVGYGLYWYCLELIASRLDKDNVTFELEEDAELISMEWSLDQLKTEEIMRYFVSLDLFSESARSGRIVCMKLANRMDESASKNPHIRSMVNKAKTIGSVNSETGFVYLIESKGLYKIGKSIDMHKRLKDIKTSNCHAVLIHSIESVDHGLLESKFHALFASKRQSGEWFNLEPSDIDFICRISDGNRIVQEGFPIVSGYIQRPSDADKIRLDKTRLDIKDMSLSAPGEPQADSTCKPSNPEKPKIPPCPHAEIIELWHEILPELPAVLVDRWGGQRQKNLRARWREKPRHQDLNFWRSFFNTIRTNSHWMTGSGSDWRPKLEWFVERKHFDQVYDQAINNRKEASNA